MSGSKCNGSPISCPFIPKTTLCSATCARGVCTGAIVLRMLADIDGIDFNPDTQLSELDGCTLNLLMIKAEREFGVEMPDTYPRGGDTIRNLVDWMQERIPG